MKKLIHTRKGRSPGDSNRLGSILVLATAVMIMILGFVVFSVDVGYIALSKGQLQNAVDAGALAAAMDLDAFGDQGAVMTVATKSAKDVSGLHRAGDHANVSLEGNLGDVDFGRRTFDSYTGKYTFGWGPDYAPYNAVRVTARRSEVLGQEGNVQEDNQLPLFFGPILGAKGATIQTSAIATFLPRDIVCVYDLSGSMNDLSELKSIYSLDQLDIEDNIYQIWEELGSPTYGNMDFTPDWVTVPGQPEQNDKGANIPHIDVTWKGTSVEITCTMDLSNVVLEFEDGTRERDEDLIHLEGTGTPNVPFAGTGANAGKLITRVWVKSGKNFDYKEPNEGTGYGEEFDFFDDNDILKGLGLDSVPYPYPSGSWNDYIAYARSHQSGMPWHSPVIETAGYRRKFGLLTLINFWNAHKPLATETPGLWQTSQQPLTALKNGINSLADYIVADGGEDRLGLSSYTNPQKNGATLEVTLDSTLDILKNTVLQRQAAHYNAYSNIGAGMKEARLELEANGRPGASLVMVLITDGHPNVSSSEQSPLQSAMGEAQKAASSGIRIHTISLGPGADQNFVQQVASTTGGFHYHAAGITPAEFETQLQEIFHKVARNRPLKLIQTP